MMTPDMDASLRASRFRVPRTRGAASGILLLVLGAWAALAPLIGPYFNLAYTPSPDDAWHWTAARAWFEVAPGVAACLGGVLLVVSTSRLVTSLGGWLAAAAGVWLIIGPPLDGTLTIDLGTPDPASSIRMQALESMLLFYGVGAAILLLAGLALGRLSVHGVRDVQAAERRLAAEEAEEPMPTAYLREPDDVGRHGWRDDETAVAPPPVAEPDPEPAQPSYATPPTQPTYPPPYGQPTVYSPTRDESTYARTAAPPRDEQ
jgi:hypothetical protein